MQQHKFYDALRDAMLDVVARLIVEQPQAESSTFSFTDTVSSSLHHKRISYQVTVTIEDE